MVLSIFTLLSEGRLQKFDLYFKLYTFATCAFFLVYVLKSDLCYINASLAFLSVPLSFELNLFFSVKNKAFMVQSGQCAARQ